MRTDAAAIDLAQLSRDIFSLEQRGEDLQAAAARGRKAQALARQHQYGEAADELGHAEQLARRAHRPDLQARYLLAQGLTMGRSASLRDGARAALARAAAVARQCEDGELELVALRRELELVQHQGNASGSLSRANWLLRRAEELNRVQEQVDALRTRALLQLQAGAPAYAQLDLDTALERARGAALPLLPLALERSLLRESSAAGDLFAALQDLLNEGLDAPALAAQLRARHEGGQSAPIDDDGGVVAALSHAAHLFAAEDRVGALKFLLDARGRAERGRDREARQFVALILDAWERVWGTEELAKVLRDLESHRADHSV